MKKCKVLLFDDFETLDVFGPVEALGHVPNLKIELCSISGGLISSRQGYQVSTTTFDEQKIDILLVPGGQGTRELVNNTEFLFEFEKILKQSRKILSVCTGAALLAKTNYLNDLEATTNKLAFDWVTSLNKSVKWQKQARWVTNDFIYTSSGVSAGIDMTLSFISDQYGEELAENIAKRMEYIWKKDSDNDPFAIF